MKGDFIGFSFDGIHSSDLNIIRVSDGDRFDEVALPEIEDITTSIPGRDGDLYFASQYKTRSIKISIAYDKLTEKDFRRMVKLFSTKKICPLIFDERPYKVYMAKLESPIELNYICFDEKQYEEIIHEGEGIRGRDLVYKRSTGTTERIYKGEGTIELVATFPFAKSQFKNLDYYGDYNFVENGIQYVNGARAADQISADDIVPYGNPYTIYTNVNEWAAASAILPYSKYKEWNIDQVQASGEIYGYNAYIPVYNPGDVDAPYNLFIPYVNTGLYNNGTLDAESGEYIYISSDDEILAIRPFTARQPMRRENGIIINTYNHLIEGVLFDEVSNTWATTGEVYNNYIEGGDFGKIKNIDWDLNNERITQALYLNCNQATNAKIFYDYLYY